MLKTHYRQPIDWTVKALEEAEKTLDKWYSIVRDDENPEDGIDDEAVATLCDDLNTSAVLGLLHQIAAAEANIARPNPANPPIKRLRNTANLLGLLQSTESGWRRLKQASTEVDAGAVQSLITARLAARAAKNWAESDRIRDELLAMGVQLKDNKDGTTTWEVKR